MKHKIILIEDEPAYQDGWKDVLPEAELLIYSDPDEFSEAHIDHDSLDGVSIIIFDYRFDDYDANDKELVHYIRDTLKYKGWLGVWSLEESLPRDLRLRCDAVLPKRIMPIKELMQCFTERLEYGH